MHPVGKDSEASAETYAYSYIRRQRGVIEQIRCHEKARTGSGSHRKSLRFVSHCGDIGLDRLRSGTGSGKSVRPGRKLHGRGFGSRMRDVATQGGSRDLGIAQHFRRLPLNGYNRSQRDDYRGADVE